MAIKKRTANKPNGPYPWQSSVATEDLDPAERIAHDILAGRRDLLPSVGRIMTAGLGAEDTLRAIGLFRDSLTNADDVNRDPRVAIARCTPAADQTSVTPER